MMRQDNRSDFDTHRAEAVARSRDLLFTHSAAFELGGIVRPSAEDHSFTVRMNQRIAGDRLPKPIR